MRKLTGLKVVLLVVGLLTIAGAPPATAQLGDPLSLAASGVLLPYFNDPAAGFVSVLEVVNPVVATGTGPVPEVLNQNNPIHLIYFSQTCVRDGSFPDIFTPKQAKAYVLSQPNLNVGPPNGLVAIAKSINQNDLDPLDYPLWTRIHWIDAKTGKLRELEPIIVDTYANTQLVDIIANDQIWGSVGLCAANGIGSATTGAGAFCWNPLRSGGMFVTPQELPTLAATLILICPRSSIQSTTGGIVSPARFPTLVNRDGTLGFPAANNAIQDAATTIEGNIYDDNEAPGPNIRIPCDCLTVQAVKPISPVYSLPPTPLNTYTVPVWYTELHSSLASPNALNITGGPQSQHFSWTGYWNLDLIGGIVDNTTLFHRLSNSSADNIRPGNGGKPNAFGNR